MKSWSLLGILTSRACGWLQHEVFPSQFVRNVSVLTLSRTIGTVLNVVQGVVVARALGPTEYGIAGLVLSYPGLVFALLDARSSDASVKYLGEFSSRNEYPRVLGMAKLGYVVDASVALATFSLVAVSADWISENVVKSAGLAPLILVQAAAFLPGSLSGTSRAILMTLEAFGTLARIELIATAVRVALIVGFVLSGFGVAGVIWGNALGLGLRGLIMGLAAHKSFRDFWGSTWLQGSIKELRGRGREIARFLFYNDVNSLLGLLVKQLALPLLGFFRGPTEAGYYRLGTSIASITSNLVGPLQSVAYPRLSKLQGEGKIDQVSRLTKRYALSVGLPLGALVLLVLPFVPVLIRFVYGQEFLPSAPASQLLLAGSAVWLAFFWLRPTIFAMGEVRLWTGISALAFVLSILGFLLIIPSWGYIGSMDVGHAGLRPWFGCYLAESTCLRKVKTVAG